MEVHLPQTSYYPVFRNTLNYRATAILIKNPPLIYYFWIGPLHLARPVLTTIIFHLFGHFYYFIIHSYHKASSISLLF